MDALKEVNLPALAYPDHMKLRPAEFPFWKSILANRFRDEWSEVELGLAVRLARVQAELESQSRMLRKEGAAIKVGHVVTRINPRAAYVEQLSRREMALIRSLRMTGSALGNSGDEVNKRQLLSRAREAKAEVDGEDDDDPLLPMS